jgi:hypothetical protein
MKLPEMKWTQRNCIMCALVIIAIFLTMYLFRHYTLIEGFDFSMPDTSAITSSTSSLTSSISIPSFSSGFGAIGPLPADNVISQETLDAVRTAYADTIMKQQPPGIDFSKYATEDEAKAFVTNKKWTFSSTLLDCIKTTMETGAKQAHPDAELTEDQKKMIENFLNRFQSLPPRYMIANQFLKDSLSMPCLKEATQSSLLSKIFNSLMFLSSGPDTKMPIPYQLDKNDNSKSTKYLYCNNSQPTIVNWDEANNKTVSTPTTYSEFPNIIKSAKFNFIGKDGKTIDSPPDGFDLCNPAKIQQSPFILDNGGVSPFYSAFWGVPTSNSSGTTDSTPAAVSSSDDPTVVLKDMKAKLNSMSL